MTLNGGYGDVTSLKNKMLVPQVSEKITAVKKNNGVDYWVVVHRWDSDEFISISVTSAGVDTNNFVISKAGSVHSGPLADNNNAVGFMKISPDGSKLALAIYGLQKFEICDFDNLTGKVTDVFPKG